MKKKISMLGFLGLLLISSIINVNTSSRLLITNDNPEYYNEINVKPAGFWNLTGSSIVIDDLNPTMNWAYTASNYDWCSGSGTLLDPYLIENVTIGGQGSGNCIEILNSNVHFILKNCTVYNSGSFRTGIFLNNTNNGKIIDNDCVKHKNHGIYLYSSDNNILSGNTVNNNAITGIHLFLSNNNTLSGNTANNNTNDGVHLYLSDNNTLSGNTANNNTVSGIHLFSSNNNTLSGNIANNNTNDGIHLYLSDNNMLSGNSANKTYVGIKLFFSNNATLSGNILKKSFIGIYLEGSNNTMLSGNTVNNNTNTGIYLFFSNNNTLSGNTANNNIYNGIYLWTSNNAMLSENIVNNNTNYGFYLENSNNATLSGNTVNNNTDYGFYLESSNNAMLSGNMVNNTSYGIYLGNSNNSMLSGNIVNNNTNYGFYLENSNNATLSVNTVNNNNVGIILGDSNNAMFLGNTVNNNTSYGFYLWTSNNTTLSGNTVNNSDYGIYLGMSNNATILGNTVNKNNIGIYLWTSNYTTLSGNMVSNNTNIGISQENSNNNIFSNNIIRSNKQWGIYISVGSVYGHNLFFKNYFINNTIHAEDKGMNNYWNNSVIGNYWDTYTGTDADNDGIGDMPYIFTGGIDYLPIVEITTPIIIVNFPNSEDVFGNIAPNFNVEIISIILDTMWYSLNDGTNVSFTTNGTIDQSEWNALPDGNVSIFFYANDTLGNIRVFEIIIEKDTTPPKISILTPELNEKFGQTAPGFTILIEEQNLDKMWYIIEGIDHKNFIDNTIGTINQTLWDSLSEGDITLKFYANDTVGNVDHVQLIIIKAELPSSNILGYNLFILIGAIIVVILIVYKKRLFTKL